MGGRVVSRWQPQTDRCRGCGRAFRRLLRCYGESLPTCCRSRRWRACRGSHRACCGHVAIGRGLSEGHAGDAGGGREGCFAVFMGRRT
eukprot:5956723-Amphidinium_carterae.1